MALPETAAQRVLDKLALLSSVEGFQRSDLHVHNMHESTRLAWRSHLARERGEYFRQLSARAAAYF